VKATAQITGLRRLVPTTIRKSPQSRSLGLAIDIDAVVATLQARGAELVVEVDRYEESYRLCYVRGPEGIIVELAEQIG
jgi:catechol 2,3-dioxygenase-like lactoylglutathione lyase family enzyme